MKPPPDLAALLRAVLDDPEHLRQARPPILRRPGVPARLRGLLALLMVVTLAAGASWHQIVERDHRRAGLPDALRMLRTGSSYSERVSGVELARRHVLEALHALQSAEAGPLRAEARRALDSIDHALHGSAPR